jgi:hypothetical protein
MSSRTPVLLARVVGTTPCSSSLQPLLTTLCKQISYNLDLSYEDIPQDLVPLKTYFKVEYVRVHMYRSSTECVLYNSWGILNISTVRQSEKERQHVITVS